MIPWQPPPPHAPAVAEQMHQQPPHIACCYHHLGNNRTPRLHPPLWPPPAPAAGHLNPFSTSIPLYPPSPFLIDWIHSTCPMPSPPALPTQHSAPQDPLPNDWMITDHLDELQMTEGLLIYHLDAYQLLNAGWEGFRISFYFIRQILLDFWCLFFSSNIFAKFFYISSDLPTHYNHTPLS